MPELRKPEWCHCVEDTDAEMDALRAYFDARRQEGYENPPSSAALQIVAPFNLLAKGEGR